MAHKIDCDPYKEQHSPTPLLDQSYLLPLSPFSVSYSHIRLLIVPLPGISSPTANIVAVTFHSGIYTVSSEAFSDYLI